MDKFVGGLTLQIVIDICVITHFIFLSHLLDKIKFHYVNLSISWALVLTTKRLRSIETCFFPC